MLKGSEECYVFLCVENQLNDKFAINYDTESWLKVGEKDDKTVYAYKSKVNALHAEKDVALDPIFTEITVSEALTSDDVKQLGKKNLNVTAYAVQTASLKSDVAIDLAVVNFLGEGITPIYVEIK